jgi:hypothetical protein
VELGLNTRMHSEKFFISKIKINDLLFSSELKISVHWIENVLLAFGVQNA